MNYQEAIKGYTGIIQAYALAARTHESLTHDAWSVMVKEIDAALKSGKTDEQIKSEMKQAEDTWKASTGDTSMPSTYRSAKAVALKAVASKISLVNEDGSIKGKTAIEQAYKAASTHAKEGKEESAPVDHRLRLYRAYDNALPVLTDEEKREFLTYVTARTPI